MVKTARAAARASGKRGALARRSVGAAEVAAAVTVVAALGRSVVSRVVKKGDRHTPERNVCVKGEEKNGEAAET